MDPSLPDDVRALLLAHVGEYEDLEVLLRLVRAPAGRSVTVAPGAEREAAARLASSGLAEAPGDGTARYRPATADLDRRVRRLADVYEDNPSVVLRFLTRASMERLRTSAARAFADAFRLRRDGDDG